MNVRTVAITRPVGTAGDAVGREVGRLLGLRVVDYEVIQRAAEQAGVSAEAMSAVERRGSLVSRMLEALARAQPAPGELPPAPTEPGALFTSGDYRATIEGVVRDLATEGGRVIVGHGSVLMLRNHDDVLRVFVSASRADRIKRLVAEMHLSEREAGDLVSRTDRERVDYFTRLYQLRWTDPANYDLCVDADRLGVPGAAEVVAAAARAGSRSSAEPCV